MEQKKKKLVAIFTGIGTALLAITFVIIFVFATKSTNLENPTGLAVVETQNKTIVCVDPLEDALKYRFVITPSGESDGQVANLFTHQFDASSYFQIPGEYTISCQYIGKNDLISSKETTITYTAKHKVALPTITFENNNLKLELADHFYEEVNLTATLFYTVGQTVHTSTNFTAQTNDKHGILIGYFNLENILTSSGTYSLCVQITTDNNLYVASDFTQQYMFTLA